MSAIGFSTKSIPNIGTSNLETVPPQANRTPISEVAQQRFSAPLPSVATQLLERMKDPAAKLEESTDNNYLHPKRSHPIPATIPIMTNTDLVTGVYYNILFPEERK